MASSPEGQVTMEVSTIFAFGCENCPSRKIISLGTAGISLDQVLPVPLAVSLDQANTIEMTDSESGDIYTGKLKSEVGVLYLGDVFCDRTDESVEECELAAEIEEAYEAFTALPDLVQYLVEQEQHVITSDQKPNEKE